MRNIILFLVLTSFLACSSSDDGNSLLPDVPVNVTLNLNLPAYQDLLINNGSVFVPGHGIKGIIVFRLSESSIFAWDAACPHISPQVVLPW